MKKEGGNYAKLEHFVERTALLFVEGRTGDGGGRGEGTQWISKTREEDNEAPMQL